MGRHYISVQIPVVTEEYGTLYDNELFAIHTISPKLTVEETLHAIRHYGFAELPKGTIIKTTADIQVITSYHAEEFLKNAIEFNKDQLAIMSEEGADDESLLVTEKLQFNLDGLNSWQSYKQRKEDIKQIDRDNMIKAGVDSVCEPCVMKERNKFEIDTLIHDLCYMIKNVKCSRVENNKLQGHTEEYQESLETSSFDNILGSLQKQLQQFLLDLLSSDEQADKEENEQQKLTGDEKLCEDCGGVILPDEEPHS